MVYLKRTLIVCVLIFVGVISAYAELRSSVIGPTLGVAEAAKSLGVAPFNEEKFKNGTSEQRASMAADLLRRKKDFVGLSFPEVRKRLGRFTGYFWNDQFPSYLLNDRPAEGTNAWQIVFLPGKGWKVGDIVVNQNNR